MSAVEVAPETYSVVRTNTGIVVAAEGGDLSLRAAFLQAKLQAGWIQEFDEGCRIATTVAGRRRYWTKW